MIQVRKIPKLLWGSIKNPIIRTIIAPEPEFWIEDKKKLVVVNTTLTDIFFSELHIYRFYDFTQIIGPRCSIRMLPQTKRLVGYFDKNDEKRINTTRVWATYSNQFDEKQKIFEVKNRD